MSWFKKIARFSTVIKILSITAICCLLLAYLAPYVHPSTIRILPFFGLMYPIFICLTLVLMIYWAFARSRWFFYLLIAILFGGNLHFRTLSITFSEPTLENESLAWNVMSYNVRLFDVYNSSLAGRNESRNNIVKYIQEVNPDVVCFQEFFHQDKPSSFSTRDTLIDLLDYKYYHERYSHRIRNRQNFGICMLSKYPIIAKGDVMFENFKTTDNYCIFADIVKGDDTIRFYNIHLQSIKLQQEDYELFGEKNKQAGGKKSTARLLIDKLRIAYPERAEQAERVVEHLKTSPYPVVICGDFNDTPMSYVYNQFNSDLVDSFRETQTGIGITYVGRVPAGRIDYIFHSGDLGAVNFQIQAVPYSDHRAVHCKIYKKAL
ncbi:endonuclease/exonuclease/phosphatase family protein [Fluviicola taffensis]|uniref:Endonuclease/exonuclease/phosphatase n=1 Tax=Fluviicola taffensis (strain DSM 16823 / NCIMB 13979 / RW262) TaxID=755732 RepID=F2ID89_FLUTR|nr:endonuclease/exonuclease/phosphatase family protein [Fluviicola taffensis]AEA45504.1 Endonuclease/exonuclease/phosphatase [Fluviicola taffensis DSM 16823]